MVVLFIVFGSAIAVALVSFALKQNINLFFPPEQVVQGKAPIGTPLRVGGMVVKGSIKRAPDSLKTEFQVTDFKATVTIIYEGILPDLFGEDQGAVAAGVLNEDKVLIATEVLAKHDENYMPPEVQDAIKDSHGGQMPQQKAPTQKPAQSPSVNSTINHSYDTPLVTPADSVPSNSIQTNSVMGN
jgi:cytochrome c-type biogenesis protein CcmE